MDIHVTPSPSSAAITRSDFRSPILGLRRWKLEDRWGGKRRSLGIGLDALRRRLVEKDKGQGVAGLSRCIAAQARYRSRHATDVLRNDLAEAVALDGHLLPRFDLVVEPHEMLDEPGLDCDDRERTVAHKNI